MGLFDRPEDIFITEQANRRKKYAGEKKLGALLGGAIETYNAQNSPAMQKSRKIAEMIKQNGMNYEGFQRTAEQLTQLGWTQEAYEALGKASELRPKDSEYGTTEIKTTDENGKEVIKTFMTVDGIPTQELASGARFNNKPMVEVNLPSGDQDKFDKEYWSAAYDLAKPALNELAKEKTKAMQAVNGLTPSLQMVEMLERGDMFTGRGASLKLELAKQFKFFGMATDDMQKSINDTENYIAITGNKVADVITAFGAGTGLSDADRAYALKIAGGDYTNSEQALRDLAYLNYKYSMDRLNNYNTSVAGVSESLPQGEPYKGLRRLVMKGYQVKAPKIKTDTFDSVFSEEMQRNKDWVERWTGSVGQEKGPDSKYNHLWNKPNG